VRPDGTLLLPFMPFADLSDDDLAALISFLRAEKAIDHEIAPHEPTLIGRIALAFIIEPKGPSMPVRKRVPSGPTPEYGRYLANSAANCVTCHTAMDKKTGSFTGPRFGGGGVHEAIGDPSRSFVTPNLTPDPRWGWVTSWSEDGFVHRFKAGKLYPDSPMPWSSFATMTDDDLRAIYRFLRTLPPSPGGPDPKTPGSVKLDAKHTAQKVASR
jgi:mono/diheme cytochrome c family protein